MPARASFASYDELVSALQQMTDVQREVFFASLHPDDLALVEGVLAETLAIGWRANPATMANHFDHRFKLWRYIQFLAGKFVDAVDGRDPLQIWNVAGRYGKSTLASRWGPIWNFDRHPEANIILSSYSDALAEENAAFVRDTLAQYGDQLRTQLQLDRRGRGRFRTAHGGGLLAAGLHASITGFGAGNGGGIILDDPYKGFPEAHSETIRLDVSERYRTILRLRRDDEAAYIIVVHARMHEEDLSGELKKMSEDETGEHWSTYALASLAQEGDPLGRAPGEPLEPDKFSVEEVRARIAVAGAYEASALELQNPTPEEGGELKRAWFKIATPPPQLDVWCTTWDMKLKDKEAGDYAVGLVMGRVGPDFWIMDGLRGLWPQAYAEVAMCLLKVRYPQIQTHVVENAGYGPEVKQSLSRARSQFELDDETAGALGITLDERPRVQRLMRMGLPGLRMVQSKGDKKARARAFSGAGLGGNIHVNEQWQGLGAFIGEMVTFPKGAHDDQVDAWSQGMKHLDEWGFVEVHEPGITAIRPSLVTPKSQIRR